MKLFSQKNLTRFLILLIIILSLMAGYYQASLVAERKKYSRLEDKYVRVREELGVDETQRLIDQSRQ